MNEIVVSEAAKRPPRRAFQFRIATLLWVILVVSSFFAGRYYDALVKSVDTNTGGAPQNWATYSIPIAIAGPIDIDGDGSDDLLTLRKLISNNGGTVVAFQRPDGTVSGKLDANTRYLVVADPSDPKITSNRLVMDANKQFVQLISVEKLLRHLGIQSNKSTKIGSGFRSRVIQK